MTATRPSTPNASARRRERARERRRTRIRSIATLVVGVVIGLAGLGFAAVALTDAVPAALGRGVPGTFSATQQHCGSKGRCSWSGTFHAADDAFLLTGVRYEDRGVDRPGDSIEAVVTDGPASHRAFARHGSTVWVPVLVVALFFGAVAAGCTYALARSVRGPRR